MNNDENGKNINMENQEKKKDKIDDKDTKKSFFPWPNMKKNPPKRKGWFCGSSE